MVKVVEQYSPEELDAFADSMSRLEWPEYQKKNQEARGSGTESASAMSLAQGTAVRPGRQTGRRPGVPPAGFFRQQLTIGTPAP
jgi:hypothetical protein